MTSTQEQVARYFSGREVARKFAFSRICGDELHAVFSDVAPYYDLADAAQHDRLGRDAETLSPLIVPLVERSARIEVSRVTAPARDSVSGR